MKNISEVLKTLLPGSKAERIEYFHPSDRTLPDSGFYGKGGFMGECVANSRAFAPNTDFDFLLTPQGEVVKVEAATKEQFHFDKTNGGIIVFPNAAANVLSQAAVLAWVAEQKDLLVKTVASTQWPRGWAGIFEQEGDFSDSRKADYRAAWSVGNFFLGHYLGANGIAFGIDSICLEINGLSINALIQFAQKMCLRFQQTAVLVRGVEGANIFLVEAS